jgi:hypothetical protein
MKDVRGSHASAVRNAIFRIFKLHPITSRRKNSQEVLKWKKSEEIEDCYNKLYNDRNMIENIAMSAFPSLNTATEDVFNDIYIYTALICDIILNPDHPSLDVSKSSLELRMQMFRVFVKFILKKIKIIN